MKIYSGHIIFKNDIQFKDLVPVYKELCMKFLEETDQIGVDPVALDVTIEVNMLDLRKNRKPEGFNRIGDMRLIFPITDDNTIQFYIYSISKSDDVIRVTYSLSKFLKKKGLAHDVQWDKMLWHRDNILHSERMLRSSAGM